MKRALIPWHVFREALESQDAEVLHNWFDRWGFTNDGVVLIGFDIGSQPETVSDGQRLAQDAPEALARLSLNDLIQLLTREASPFINQETVALWSWNKEL
jgi:hypothetical protein